jgi:hypothetical protein
MATLGGGKGSINMNDMDPATIQMLMSGQGGGNQKKSFWNHRLLHNILNLITTGRAGSYKDFCHSLKSDKEDPTEKEEHEIELE